MRAILGVVGTLLLLASGSTTMPPRAVAAYGDSDSGDARSMSGAADAGRSGLAGNGAAWQGAGKGAGIDVYVVDTGVDDIGIFTSIGAGYHAVGSSTRDCGRNHGTYVASIVAGIGYGVAESATIVPVRVLQCDGSGSKPAVVKGLKWILAHARPARSVVNMSFGGRKDKDLDSLVTKLSDKGIPVVIAAGNEATPTSESSPTRTGCTVPLSVVVAASTDFDAPWMDSNYGACVSIYAPGRRVRAFGSNGPKSVTGTSFAAPYVAGAIAAYASEYHVTTEEAWRLVIAHASPAITIGNRVNTTSLRLQLVSRDAPAEGSH